MKQIIITLAFLASFGNAYSQSKLDKLTANPSKEDGHFVGKVESAAAYDPFMGSYSLAFDFWTMFNEPVYMFYFKWDYVRDHYQHIWNKRRDMMIDGNTHFYRYTEYPDIEEKMKKSIVPLTDMSDSKLLTVPLTIEFRKGGASLATVKHDAKIDLPDPAGKWNVFALPGSNDWIKVFHPTITGVGKYDSDVKYTHNKGDKDAYAKLMISIWKEADNIKVHSLVGDIHNIRWDISGYEYAIRGRLKEEKNSEKSPEKRTAESSDDDFWGSTGYSEKDRAKDGAERADAAYCKITDYKDKAALNEAKRLYQQATDDPETAAHAKNQIAMIDRILNYKELKVSKIENMEVFRDARSKKYGLKIKNGNILADAKYDRIYVNNDSSLFCGKYNKNTSADLYDNSGRLINKIDLINKTYLDISSGVRRDNDNYLFVENINEYIFVFEMVEKEDVSKKDDNGCDDFFNTVFGNVTTYNLAVFSIERDTKNYKMVDYKADYINCDPVLRNSVETLLSKHRANGYIDKKKIIEDLKKQ